MSVGPGQPGKLDGIDPETGKKRFFYFTPKGERVFAAPGQRIIVREDGRIEQACDHGVGHPIGHWKPDGWVASWMGVHGCDGCCSLAKFHLEGMGKRVE